MTWAWSPSRRIENGKEKRGFETYVGGGLGAVPYQAKLFDSFVPPEELLPLAQSIARVFARLGEKKNRSRARIKFLVQDLGIEKFKELVLEERKSLPHDPRWTEFIEGRRKIQETPLRPGGKAPLLGTEVFPALGENQYPAAETRRLHGSHDRASAGRHYRRLSCDPGGHRAPLYQGNDPLDGRAKYRPSLGQPKRSDRVAQGSRSRGTRATPARAASLTSPPARGRTLASWGFPPRAVLRRSCARGWTRKIFSSTIPLRNCTSRSAAASIVAASITWPIWVFTA